MGKGLRFIAASLLGIVFAMAGTGTALAASITDLQITGVTYNPQTDVATVTAVVTCSETIELRAFSVIYQGSGRSDRQASYAGGIDSVTCSTTPTTLTLESTELLDSARLHPGMAHVNVFVESIASPLTTFRGESADLRITVERP